MVAMVPEAHVVALNGYLRRERAAHRATRRFLTVVLHELMTRLGPPQPKLGRGWSPARARRFLTVLRETGSARAAARAVGTSYTTLRRWRLKHRVPIVWRGRRAMFAAHWHHLKQRRAPWPK